MAFSPNGILLATGGVFIKVWNLASRHAIATLPSQAGDGSYVGWDVAFSPDGRLLAGASGTNIWLWDTSTFKRLRVLADAADKVRFSPDGRFLVAATTNSLVLRDTRSWHVVRRLKLQVMVLPAVEPALAIPFEFGLAFSPDGKRLAVMSNDGIRVLSVPRLHQALRISEQVPRIRPIAFSPDGRTLAAVTATGRAVNLWDADTGKRFWTLSGHSDSVFGMAFSPDGKRLATCSADQTLKLWDVASGKLLRTFLGHAQEVWGIAYSPDGKRLASVAKDGSVKVWDPSSPPPQVTRLRNSILALGFNSAGNLVARRVEQTNSILAALDPETLQTESDVSFDPRFQKGFAVGYWPDFGFLFRDGRTVAFPMRRLSSKTPFSQWLDVWDLSRGQFLCSLHGRLALGAVFAPKRRLIARSMTNDTVSLWQIPTGTRVAVLTNELAPVAFSPDETMLATYRDSSGVIDVWKIGDGPPHRLATFDSGGGGAAFSPDSRLFAVGTDEDLIQLWALPSARLVRTLVGHKRSVIEPAFSPDGRTLASMADDGTVRFWQVATGRQLLRFNIPMDEVRSEQIEFSPDGRSLAANWADERGFCIQVWFAPSPAEIAVAEGKDYRSLAKDAANWLDVGQALEKRNRLAEALAAYAKAANRSTNEPIMGPVRHTAWLRRSKLLLRLGRFTEADADNCDAFGVPPRAARTPARCIDLSPWFNLPLGEDLSTIPHRPFLVGLPRGLQSLPGAGAARFDLRGVIQIGGKFSDESTPRSVVGIRVRQNCTRLLFLESAQDFSSEQGWMVKMEGREVAHYVVHYADGKQAEIPVRYGQNVRDWVVKTDPGGVTDSKVAWTGTHPKYGKIRVFEQTWTNPRPQVKITTLDLVSQMTQCAPFLIAITAE